MVETSDYSVERTVTLVAHGLHDSWIETRRQADGTFTPRWKDDGEGGSVDIANTSYTNLPHRWQEEKLAAAKSAIWAIITHQGDIEAAASDIHDDWLERNGEQAEPHQKLPYPQLSEEEKEKDRMVARIAKTTLLSETA